MEGRYVFTVFIVFSVYLTFFKINIGKGWGGVIPGKAAPTCIYLYRTLRGASSLLDKIAGTLM